MLETRALSNTPMHIGTMSRIDGRASPCSDEDKENTLDHLADTKDLAKLKQVRQMILIVISRILSVLITLCILFVPSSLVSHHTLSLFHIAETGP